jgi:DNA-directed RNA polymerase subunit D
MKVNVLELTERKARMTIEESLPYFPNSLRRVLLSEVPKLAIHNVVIYDNNSGLFDEIVAHRIGLLPVPTDLDVLNFRAECTCEGQGCPSCMVRFTLSKEGPTTVYAEDLQPEDPKATIAEPKVPIVDLLKGQRLILEAEAELGRGRQHAKWQPVTGAGYTYFVSLPGGQKTQDIVKNAAKDCPRDAAKVKGGYNVTDKGGHVTLCDGCLGEIEADGVALSYDETKFVFQFETDGSLTARQALLKALDILKGRVTAMAEQAETLKAVAQAEA